MLVLLGLVMLGLAGLMGYGPYHIVTTWPSAEAVVVASDVFSTITHTRGSGARGIVYGAAFAFRYNVGGRPYVSRTDIGYRTSSKSEMVEWTRTLPVGMHHAIRYHPLDPTRISLAVGFDTMSFAPVLVLVRWGLMSGGAGAALLLLVKR
jgi:hypothetical protein